MGGGDLARGGRGQPGIGDGERQGRDGGGSVLGRRTSGLGGMGREMGQGR